MDENERLRKLLKEAVDELYYLLLIPSEEKGVTEIIDKIEKELGLGKYEEA